MHEVHVNKWLLTVTVMLGTMMNAIDTSIVNVAIPFMKGNLGASVEEISWVATGYILANVIIMPLISTISARIGRRTFYLLSVILFTVSSLLCGMATTLPLLVIARIVQGIGGGALGPLSQAIIRERFPPREQGLAMGLFGLGVVVGPAFGPTLGGWLVDHFSWPWIFYINIPLGLINIIMVLRYLHDPPYLQRQDGKMDLAGLFFLIIALGALQLALEQGEQKQWFDSTIITILFALALLCMAMFIIRELSIPHPVVDLSLLGDRSFASSVLLSGVLGMGLYSGMFLLPLFLQQYLGFPAIDSGLAQMPRSIAMGLTMPLAGNLYNRFGPRVLVGCGLICTAASFFLLTRLSLDVGTDDLILPQVLQGIGFGMMFVSVSTTAMASIEKTRMMAASGLYNVFRQIFGSVGIALTATLFTRGENSHRAMLGEHVSLYDPTASTWLATLSATLAIKGGDTVIAETQAQQLLERSLMRQAGMLSFNRIYWALTLLFLCALPLVFLLQKRTVPAVVDAMPD